MTVAEHIETVVRSVITDTNLNVVSDYAIDYEDFITNYSRHLPGALITFDGFDVLEDFTKGTVWEHTYRLIINLKRSTLAETYIKQIRDNMQKIITDGADDYYIKIVGGYWLPIDKSKSTFEFRIKAMMYA